MCIIKQWRTVPVHRPDHAHCPGDHVSKHDNMSDTHTQHDGHFTKSDVIYVFPDTISLHMRSIITQRMVQFFGFGRSAEHAPNYMTTGVRYVSGWRG